MSEIMYRENTNGIEIEVVPKLVPPSQLQNQFPDQFVYTYSVTIINHSEKPLKLLRRHWIIVDGTSRQEEVYGDGVIGQQPIINPGDSFQYSSFCPLKTPTGNMRGHYEMVDQEGNEVKVKIPLFFLRDNSVLH